jgi:poly(beta-D-mannuronate) lyase
VPSLKHALRTCAGAATLAVLTVPTAIGPADAAAVPRVTGAAAAPQAATPASPSDVLDLSHWKLTLPVDTGHAGSPDEYTSLRGVVIPPYFTLTPARDAVVFRANAGGATTGGSSYPRSELREMDGSGGRAAWSTTSGTHTLTVTQAITHLPTVKPHVTAAQIHDSADDVAVVRLEGKHLFVEHDGRNLGDLNTNYQLGTVYTVKMVAADGRISVYYNGARKVDIPASTDGCYFKVGAYTQSNPSKGEAKDAYGEVVLHDLKISHT